MFITENSITPVTLISECLLDNLSCDTLQEEHSVPTDLNISTVLNKFKNVVIQ